MEELRVTWCRTELTEARGGGGGLRQVARVEIGVGLC